jgi:hypothetical protein
VLGWLAGDKEGSADEGVVGCVESTSDGGCDVEGVSDSDCVIMSFTSESCVESGSGVGGLGCDDGSSKGDADDWGALRFRRRRRALGGKGSSGTDNQGT